MRLKNIMLFWVGAEIRYISNFYFSPKKYCPAPLVIRIAASPDKICPFYAPQNPSLSQYLPAFVLIIGEVTGVGKIELYLQEIEGSFKMKVWGFFENVLIFTLQ